MHFNSNGENYNILNYKNSIFYITLIFNFLGVHTPGVLTLNCKNNSLRYPTGDASWREKYFGNVKSNLSDNLKKCENHPKLSVKPIL